MGKYWLFAIKRFGGCLDFVEASGDIDQLQRAVLGLDWDWWHIVDTETATVVRNS